LRQRQAGASSSWGWSAGCVHPRNFPTQAETGLEWATRPNYYGINEVASEFAPGQRGIIAGFFSNPFKAGHVFNIVNDNGTIYLLDGQSGKVGLPDSYNYFWFIRTN
jgi:hypothetical protein